MKEHMKLLGLRVKDTVTGFVGVVSTISFDLYGCVQLIVTPPADEKGVLPEGRWFDVKRLQVLDSNPVMAVPTFSAVAAAVPGPQEKPAPATNPIR
jgi:hypothetical protein